MVRSRSGTKACSGVETVTKAVAKAASAAFISLPAITTVASPKSNWAWPGGCDSGTKTSFE
jgi:hypothetical protein